MGAIHPPYRWQAGPAGLSTPILLTTKLSPDLAPPYSPPAAPSSLVLTGWKRPSSLVKLSPTLPLTPCFPLGLIVTGGRRRSASPAGGARLQTEAAAAAAAGTGGRGVRDTGERRGCRGGGPDGG